MSRPNPPHYSTYDRTVSTLDHHDSHPLGDSQHNSVDTTISGRCIKRDALKTDLETHPTVISAFSGTTDDISPEDLRLMQDLGRWPGSPLAPNTPTDEYSTDEPIAEGTSLESWFSARPPTVVPVTRGSPSPASARPMQARSATRGAAAPADALLPPGVDVDSLAAACSLEDSLVALDQAPVAHVDIASLPAPVPSPLPAATAGSPTQLPALHRPHRPHTQAVARGPAPAPRGSPRRARTQRALAPAPAPADPPVPSQLHTQLRAPRAPNPFDELLPRRALPAAERQRLERGASALEAEVADWRRRHAALEQDALARLRYLAQELANANRQLKRAQAAVDASAALREEAVRAAAAEERLRLKAEMEQMGRAVAAAEAGVRAKLALVHAEAGKVASARAQLSEAEQEAERLRREVGGLLEQLAKSEEHKAALGAKLGAAAAERAELAAAWEVKVRAEAQAREAALADTAALEAHVEKLRGQVTALEAELARVAAEREATSSVLEERIATLDERLLIRDDRARAEADAAVRQAVSRSQGELVEMFTRVRESERREAEAREEAARRVAEVEADCERRLAARERECAAREQEAEQTFRFRVAVLRGAVEGRGADGGADGALQSALSGLSGDGGLQVDAAEVARVLGEEAAEGDEPPTWDGDGDEPDARPDPAALLASARRRLAAAAPLPPSQVRQLLAERDRLLVAYRAATAARATDLARVWAQAYRAAADEVCPAVHAEGPEPCADDGLAPLPLLASASDSSFAPSTPAQAPHSPSFLAALPGPPGGPGCTCACSCGAAHTASFTSLSLAADADAPALSKTHSSSSPALSRASSRTLTPRHRPRSRSPSATTLSPRQPGHARAAHAPSPAMPQSRSHSLLAPSEAPILIHPDLAALSRQQPAPGTATPRVSVSSTVSSARPGRPAGSLSVSGSRKPRPSFRGQPARAVPASPTLPLVPWPPHGAAHCADCGARIAAQQLCVYAARDDGDQPAATLIGNLTPGGTGTRPVGSRHAPQDLLWHAQVRYSSRRAADAGALGLPEVLFLRAPPGPRAEPAFASPAALAGRGWRARPPPSALPAPTPPSSSSAPGPPSRRASRPGSLRPQPVKQPSLPAPADGPRGRVLLGPAPSAATVAAVFGLAAPLAVQHFTTRVVTTAAPHGAPDRARGDASRDSRDSLRDSGLGLGLGPGGLSAHRERDREQGHAHVRTYPLLAAPVPAMTALAGPEAPLPARPPTPPGWLLEWALGADAAVLHDDIADDRRPNFWYGFLLEAVHAARDDGAALPDDLAALLAGDAPAPRTPWWEVVLAAAAQRGRPPHSQALAAASDASQAPTGATDGPLASSASPDAPPAPEGEEGASADPSASPGPALDADADADAPPPSTAPRPPPAPVSDVSVLGSLIRARLGIGRPALKLRLEADHDADADAARDSHTRRASGGLHVCADHPPAERGSLLDALMLGHAPTAAKPRATGSGPGSGGPSRRASVHSVRSQDALPGCLDDLPIVTAAAAPPSLPVPFILTSLASLFAVAQAKAVEHALLAQWARRAADMLEALDARAELFEKQVAEQVEQHRADLEAAFNRRHGELVKQFSALQARLDALEQLSGDEDDDE